MSKFQSRQGDIWFESVSKLPSKGLKKKTDNIFAYGEVTFHSHKAISPPLDQLEMYTDDETGDIYVMSKTEDIKVWHDEHNVITLPANEWLCVSRQREFDPLAANRERAVRD